MQTRLLKTFAPLDDESGLGYYRRLSEANALSGWKELARISEVSASKSGLFSRPEHVAGMLGIDSAACHLASAREEIALGWRGIRRPGFDAVCPHCIKDSQHLRLSWNHAYVVACPTHKTLLVDKCDACGERLSDQREQIDVCTCGHQLSACKTKSATPAQLWVASVIASGGARSAEALPALKDVQLEYFGPVVRNLCQYFDPTTVATRLNASSPQTVAEAVEFLRPLENLLHDWPRGFETHVRDRIAAGPAGSRTLNTRLGPWYQRIRELGFDEALNPFLNVVHRLAVSEYAEALALDHVQGQPARASLYRLLPDAAARIGVHRDTLRKAAAAGEVLCISRPYPNQGTAYEIPFVEVDAIVAARSGWMTEQDARAVLNVPVSVYENIVLAGLVVPDYTAREDIRRGAPIERAALEKLQSSLLHGPTRDVKDEGEHLRLSEFHARKLGDKQAIQRLLKAIANGDVRPVARTKSVGELMFSKADVDLFFSSKKVDAGLSVQALFKATGWKWESISEWIDAGYLESEPAVLRGQPCRIILPEQLLKFSRTYIPLADLARSLGRRSSEMLERLQGLEIVGSRELPGGQHRGGLVRIADLARLALPQAVPEG